MPDPISPADLIFPSQPSINQTLKSLNRSHLTISNRLHSIVHDAKFITTVATTFNLPLIANERCGSWYIPPAQKAGSAYFKSTDGHNGEWSFSLRRLNVQVLDVIGRHWGCIIVDSTRRGKSMPDALSKTVPIWIAVFNRLLFPDRADCQRLRTPGDVVSTSEHAQIEQRLDGFVSDVAKLDLDLDSLRSKLNHKPMEALWVVPGRDLSLLKSSRQADRNFVVLCTASGRTVQTDSISINFGFVQGAADDHESWARGLTPTIFWSYASELLATSEDELPELIRSLASASSEDTEILTPVRIAPTNNVWIASNIAATATRSDFDFVIHCSDKSDERLEKWTKRRYIHLQCGTRKNGSRQLRTALPRLEALAGELQPDSRILVTCPTSGDLAVGVGLAVICLHFADNGSLQTSERPSLNKTIIKRRLSWILLSHPGASPSRATLQSVNAFLLG